MNNEKNSRNSSVKFGNNPKTIEIPARTPKKTNKLPSENLMNDGGKLDSSLKYFEIDGLKKMLEAKTKCGKVFWFSFILIATTTTVYEVVKSVSDYYNSPTVTTYKIVTLDKLNFPQVYICPNSVARKSYLIKNPDNVGAAEVFRKTAVVKHEIVAKHDRDRTKRNVLFDDLTVEDDFEQFLELVSSKSSKRLSRSTGDNNQTNVKSTNDSSEYITKIMMEMSVIMDDFLIACMFHQSNDTPTNIPCSKITKEVLDPNYGKCFLIDVGDAQKQTVAGQGMSLIINLNSNEYPDETSSVSVKYFGVYINVANRFDPTTFERLLVPAKAYSTVDIRAQHLQFMNIKSGPQKQLCNNDDDFHPQVLNVSYSRASCQMDCFLREVLRRCNCIVTVDKHFVNSEVAEQYKFCTSNEMATCVQYNVTDSKDANGEIQKCSEDCHIPCDSWKFHTKVSNMPLNERAFVSLKNDTKLNDIIHLQIAFPYLEYEEFTQSESMSISSLIANIGGQVGLWVGASMLTIMQIPITLFTLSGWQFYTKATPAIKEAGRKFTHANL